MDQEDEKNELVANYIVETVKQIDRMQKEIVIENATVCVTCEASLITKAYNTIPVSFTNKCGNPIKAFIDNKAFDTTNLFRIECLRDNRFVTLRLLKYDDYLIKATNQTIIFDLNCACQIQCLDPINVAEC